MGLNLSPSSASAEIEKIIHSADIQSMSNQNGDLSQVTSVSQLSDVRPTDWAFTALQSLVERYGCIAGYPDRIDRATGFHLEASYRFQVSKNISITPGIIYLTRPNQDRASDGGVIGVIRSSFTF
jgi:hypothetical protein